MPKYIIYITCLCGCENEIEWKPRFEVRCERCSKSICYRTAAIDGRVKTNDGQLIKMWNKGKKGKRR